MLFVGVVVCEDTNNGRGNNGVIHGLHDLTHFT